jgi:D-alanyl-D-alanine carboxypeptidase
VAILLTNYESPVASRGKPIGSIELPSVKTNIFPTHRCNRHRWHRGRRSPAATNAPQPSAQVAARWLPLPPADAPISTTTVMEMSTLPLSQSGKVVASAEPMPIAQTPLAKLEPKKIEATNFPDRRAKLAKVEPVSAPVKVNIAASAPYAHDGWLIQVGAFDHEDEAKQHLSMAQLKLRKELATAHPLTERVQKGDKVLYRARFTGFNEETADAVCQGLGEARWIALR